jgi:hypothetical protein
VDIVRILRAFGADCTVPDGTGKTRLELAFTFKDANDAALARRRRRFEAETAAYQPPRNADPIDAIVAAFADEPEDRDELRMELANELLPPIRLDAPRGAAGAAKKKRVSNPRIESRGVRDPSDVVVHGQRMVTCACGASGIECEHCHVGYCDACRTKVPQMQLTVSKGL